MKIGIRSKILKGLLHRGEAVCHPLYFASVAFFGHGGYIYAAGAMAVITVFLLLIAEE